MTATPRGQGTAQPERESPLASAARVPIDGLPPEALRAYAAQVAALIRFAGPPGETAQGEDDSFAAFFELDLEIQLALIASFRPEVAAAPLRREIARLEAGGASSSAAACARLVPMVKAALVPLDTWWLRLHGPPGVSGLGTARQVALLAPFARQLRNLVQQRVVSPLHDLVTAHRALFEIARGLTPELWGPIAQGAGGEPVAAAPVTELLARLATALEDIETRLVTDARTWLASPAVQAAPRPPHLALLHAFLRLLDAPRARMNEFTANHLRYHYETILGQAPRGPRADRAFVVLKAAPPTPSAAFVPVFLPAGTVLAAGKDAAGGERTYQLCADVQVDLAAVARLLTLSSRPGPATASGQQLVASDSSAGPQAAPAEVGFALMSSIFALAGGNRTISVAMQLGVAPATLAAVAYFNVYATGPDGWILLDQQAVLDAGGLALDAALDARRPAIVEHRAAVHGR